MLLPRLEHGVVAAESPGSGPGYWSGAPSAAAGERLADRIGVILAEFPQAPSLDRLGPLPVLASP